MFKKSTSFYAPVLRHLNANAESKYFENLSNLGCHLHQIPVSKISTALS